MSILIKNIDEIYTGDSLIKNGWITIKDKKIVEVNNKSEIIDEKDFEIIINAKGKIALPGLINTHTHSAMTLLRGYADDLPLNIWLEDKIWPFEAKLSGDDIYWGSKLAILEMISTGTTTFLDMYFQMDRVAQVVEESGIRAVLSEGLIEANDGYKGLNAALDFCRRWQGEANGRITTMLAPHAPYTCSKKYLMKILSLARKYEIPINMHVAETKREYIDSIESSGITPFKYLDSFNFFENKVIAAHGVYLEKEELEILANKNISIAYNPSSNMKLGSGIAPIAEMLTRGINVSFGTDGVSSNNNLDLIEESRIGSYLQKVNRLDPAVIGLEDMIKMLTINGAKALDLDCLGKIEKNYKADLILVDIRENTYYYPHHNNLSNLFYAGSGRDVDTVIIDGHLVYKDKEFLTIDREEVYYTVEGLLKKKQINY